MHNLGNQSERAPRARSIEQPYRSPNPILNCLITGRPPTANDIDVVAARIWRDLNPKGVPWPALAANAAERDRMLRAARAALGIASEHPPSAKRGRASKTRRRKLGLRWA